MPNIDPAIEDKIQLEQMEGAHGIPEFNKKTIEEGQAEKKKWSERVDEIFPAPTAEPVGGKLIVPPAVVDAEGKIQRSSDILSWNSEEEKKEKLALIKKTVAKGVTDLEFAMFIYQCKRTGLDPLSRQIYIIKRKQWNNDLKKYEEVATIQTGIDGYRSIAERTHQLAGISDAKFDSEENKNPGKATVSVYRMLSNGEKAEFVATARWDEYAPVYEDKKTGEVKIAGQWKKMPYLMLAKCAEALALRKAFPQDLSGIYTKEEMDQANKEETK